MATQMGTRLIRTLAACVALLLLVAAHGPIFRSVVAVAAEDVASEDDEGEGMLDPMGPNAACYVCHMTFIHEPLARTHLPEKVTCVKCHGISAGHANDEDIGATKPNITFTRKTVNAACRKCHEDHDVAPEKVVARWIKIKSCEQKPICTDCHGMHRIDQADAEAEED